MSTGLADSGVSAEGYDRAVSSSHSTHFYSSSAVQLHHVKPTGEEVDAGSLGREEELRWNMLDTRSCLAWGLVTVSLSLPGGSKSVAFVHTWHFHQ